jgi:predicted RNase H-like HicB family nuclease
MHRFLVIIEKAKRNYSAYSPDLPGCVATGKTLEQVRRNMLEAIDMHLQGLIEDWRNSLEIDKASTAFASMTHGAFASCGKAAMPTTLRLWTTIRKLVT